jgi:post-segregation antitoxin (ccd killing protein)
MIRTQVYIPDELHRDLMLLTKEAGVNFSTLIREGVEEVIKKKRVKKAKSWGVGFIGAIKGGPRDLSSKIDYYLYGEGNPKWEGK